ncbi:hypothetical protein ACFW3D_29840 [Streptomyces sp. NPDC058864]
MGWFLGLGTAGLVVLAVAFVFDRVLDGLGGLDGLLSLPVIAGFVSMLGFTGAIVLGSTGLGTVFVAWVGVLPQVVAKASEPMGTVDQTTVISTDGARRLSRTVPDNVAQGMEQLSSTMGVDLAELLNGITARRTADGRREEPCVTGLEAPPLLWASASWAWCRYSTSAWPSSSASSPPWAGWGASYDASFSETTDIGSST